MKKNHEKVKIRVEHGDALTFEADVIVLKYAQELYGLDYQVVKSLEQKGIEIRSKLPEVGEYHLVNSMNQIASRSILLVGVKELYYFRYQEIREFARRSLTSLAELAPETKHICLTLHGANYGLDEIEAFESEIAGLNDALSTYIFPDQLERISIIEYNHERAELLQNVLSELLPKGYFENIPEEPLNDRVKSANERLRTAGYTSDSKPHIFVAMPFKDEMKDVYDYGIKTPVNNAGFICERADFSIFTGDILEWVKRRIKTSALVIADLTDANPNVYLEVGYAWGCGVPTMLIIRDNTEPKFDVQGQRYLIYKRIKELEDLLNEQLKEFKEKSVI